MPSRATSGTCCAPGRVPGRSALDRALPVPTSRRRCAASSPRSPPSWTDWRGSVRNIPPPTARRACWSRSPTARRSRACCCRATALCVSTQVGCAVGCVFCMTGRDGLVRQLGSAEIVAQVALARARRPVRKVVFMGMGEPAHNLDNVLDAIELLGTAGGIGAQEPRVLDGRRPARVRAPAARAGASRRSRCRCTRRTPDAARAAAAARAAHRSGRAGRRWASATRARPAIRSSTSGRCSRASTTATTSSTASRACSRASTR